ncbi:MAG: MFS transporter [Anaerolineae bacterium]|nr:MFS transporter [Anaerolineae bacterium]MDW8171727.1 MFS transporter [Anaerolineae bacterium]
MSVSSSPAPVSSTNAASPTLAFNPWVVVGFILIPVFVGSLDMTVVSAFLPKLITELGLPFDTGLDDASWIVTGYLLAYTISLTFTGRLSDLVGRRAVYILCLLTFIAGSVLVAIASGWPTENMIALYRRLGLRPDPAYVELQVIVIARVVAALGAGGLVPVSLALVGDMFPPHKRAKPLGIVAAFDTLGWVLGPVYGAVFMQALPWQSLFWFNVPLTFATLAVVLYALRAVPMHKAQGRFDLLGTLLISTALASLSIGLGANLDLSGGANISSLQGLPSYALPVLALGVLAFVLFLLVEARLRHPLVRLGIFRERSIGAALLANLFIGYCLFIGLVSVPVLVNLRQSDVSQLSQAALEVGLILSSLTIPMALAAIPSGWLSERFGLRAVIMGGLSASLVGFLVMWRTWTLDIPYPFLAAQMALIGVGIGLTFSPISTAVINSARDDERGVAGALVLILRLVGMTLSTASLSSLMIYRVQALAQAAQAAEATFDAARFVSIYANSAVQVLSEMGLIGALLCGLALIPAAFVGRGESAPQNQL